MPTGDHPARSSSLRRDARLAMDGVPVAPATADAAREAEDRRADARSMVTIVAILGSTLTLAATGQSLIVLGLGRGDLGIPASLGWDVVRRILINLLTVIAAVLLVSQMRIEARRPVKAAGLVLLAAFSVAAMRALLQISAGIYSQRDIVPALSDGAILGVMVGLIIAFAVVVTRGQQRVRRAERAAAAPGVRSTAALVTMLRNQNRARQTMSAEMQAALGERFMHLNKEIEDLARTSEGLQKLQLQALGKELSEFVVTGLKMNAALAYPEALEHGIVPAVRALISALPQPIVVRLTVHDQEAINDLAGSGIRGINHRAVLLQAVAEAIMGALEHGHAQLLEIAIAPQAGNLRITVTDDGVTRERDDPDLARIRTSLAQFGGTLTVEERPEGGTRVVIVSPPAPPDSPDDRSRPGRSRRAATRSGPAPAPEVQPTRRTDQNPA